MNKSKFNLDGENDFFEDTPEKVEVKYCVSCKKEVLKKTKFCPKCRCEKFVDNLEDLEYIELEASWQKKLDDVNKKIDKVNTEIKRVEKENKDLEFAISNLVEDKDKIVDDLNKRIKAKETAKSVSNTPSKSTKKANTSTNIPFSLDDFFAELDENFSKPSSNNQTKTVKSKNQLSKKEQDDLLEQAAHHSLMGEYDKCIPILESLTELGNAGAFNSLGDKYYLGQGVEKNLVMAADMYEFADLYDNINGTFNLARCYYEGTGRDQDYKKSLELFLKAAKNNHADASYYVGIHYEKGLGVSKDLTTAIEFYENAFTLGLKSKSLRTYVNKLKKELNPTTTSTTSTKLSLAEQNKLLSDAGTYFFKEEYEKSFELYEKVANCGNPKGQFQLAKMYRFGWGTKKDLVLAADFFEKAALQGYKDSICEIGKSFYYGEGRTKDKQKAFEWFSKGEKINDKMSLFYLAIHYKNGEYVARDLKKSLEYYEKAIAAGFGADILKDDIAAIKKELAMTTTITSSTTTYTTSTSKSTQEELLKKALSLSCNKDYEQALSIYTQVANMGNPKAQLETGKMYRFGMGTSKNLKTAADWFEKSANLGYAEGLVEYGKCYYYGEGRPNNKQKAFPIFMKAAEKNNLYGHYYVALLYHYGTGVEKNLKKALDHYQKAITAGFSESILKSYIDQIKKELGVK